MPYRKTRKQKRQQKGGAGLFSLISRPKPAPPPPFESYKSSINRLYTFLYSKIDPITKGYIPLSPGQQLLSAEQKAYFRSLLEPYVTMNAKERRVYDDERFVREVLNTESVSKLDEQIREIEAKGMPLEDIVFKRPAIGESFAGSLARFLPLVFTPEEMIQYRQNWEQHICAFERGVDQNRPIQSLEEKRCILVLKDKKSFETVLPEYQFVYGDTSTIGPGFPSIIVKEKYMPQLNEVLFPYTRIQANKLMSTSYVLDAIREGGILEIQPDLAYVISQEHRRIWNRSNMVPIVLYTNPPKRLDLYGDKFVFVDGGYPVPAGTYVSLTSLTDTPKVLGMDSQSTLQLRTYSPSLWETYIPTDPNLSFFRRLPYEKQILFAVLQHMEFMKVFQSSPKTAFRTVFSLDLRIPENKKRVLANIERESLNEYSEILSKHV